jgi:CRP-like cAMP-binding protein
MGTATATIQDVLRHAEVLRGLTDDEIEMLERLCTQESHPAGARLSTQGDEIHKLYVVEHGMVHFQIHIPGDGAWSVDSSTGGDCFGWASLFGPPYRWASSAVCVQPTRLTAIEGAGLRALCHSYPHIGFVMMAGIGRVVTYRLEKVRQQVATLAAQMPSSGSRLG